MISGTETSPEKLARQHRDAALAIRIREDDVQALGELMQSYALQLTSIAFAVVGSADLSEDIVHEVFLALWEHRQTLDEQNNVAGYLYRAVRNRSISTLRHEQSQRRITNAAAARDADDARTASNDAEAVLDAADIDAQVRAALAHVSPAPREVFLLSWAAGLTYDEIADRLGMTKRSVAQQMYRATQRLALLLPKRF